MMASLNNFYYNIERLKQLIIKETHAMEESRFETLPNFWADKQRLIADFERMVHDYTKRSGHFANLSSVDNIKIGERIADLKKALDQNAELLSYLVDIKKIIIQTLTQDISNLHKPLQNYTPRGVCEKNKKARSSSVSLNERF